MQWPNRSKGWSGSEKVRAGVWVEYEPDSELRDTEQIPLLVEGGIKGFLQREVLPYAPDAWYVPKTVKIGYEISFNRYFYNPEPMRTLEEIRADILAVERETEGVAGGDTGRGFMKGAQKVDHVSPVVFFSYTHEDRDLAERIATQIARLGINTWWDEWEIRAGDSIVQKISDGLGNCTHFTVLLTPRSIDKPWVKAEMDAAFVRKLTDRVKFIPLRCDLPAGKLPPLLSGLHSPEITDASLTETVARLANDIFEVTKRPAIGSAPTLLDHPVAPYSPAAMAVAEYFCRETQHAATFDPMVGEQ